MATFIDLFAGIGGFRIAMEELGMQCVFSSEINPHASKMYTANFNGTPKGDITKIKAEDIPDFDILCAGFPCQPFSICGQKLGFEDTRGTLFFEVLRILNEKKPQAFILENVKNLIYHDHGNTFNTIIDLLSKEYNVSYKVLNARDFGLPQNRERIFIVGNKHDVKFDFEKIKKTPCNSMKEFLDEDTGQFEYLSTDEYTLLPNELIHKNEASGLIFVGYRNKEMRKRGVRPNTEHLSRVHKQPNRIYSAEGTHPTLASGETSGRYFIYIDGKVRKLTINECYRLFGFPENFIKVEPKSELYKRIGNSVCIPVVKAIAEEMKNQKCFV